MTVNMLDYTSLTDIKQEVQSQLDGSMAANIRCIWAVFLGQAIGKALISQGPVGNVAELNRQINAPNGANATPFSICPGFQCRETVGRAPRWTYCTERYNMDQSVQTS